ncbi:hypothetical protein RJZ56_005576 [Blastomyces dermatitidis]|uniref:RING finger protein n=1 Tax=Blastomyces gilchristii (strain SLH14081) TaxID=559298 RepID=A0A179UXQ9_BLAGS|nr:RING finger protein [Blastomyces gilchristii SLH14081]EQL37319.1 hypothetical protein BDFG_01290 [Blastomyces dermatitidis ATCC 26199]OAT12009.1 RING finger protein [Blastomyces gilchristii SLH14081]
MGCSNSTQAGEEPDAERTVIKSLDHYQIGTPSTNSTLLLPDVLTLETTTQAGPPLAKDSALDMEFSLDVFAENEREFDVTMLEIASEIFTELYGNPDFAPGIFAEEEKEFDLAMMDIADEIFTEQYGNQEIPAAVDTPVIIPEVKVKIEDCSVCYHPVSETALSSPCKSCTTRTCTVCIRKMFISACSDESCMPPRCCGPLNIGAAVSVLTPDELEMFKSKHEEWATANRVYCPVPICSAFIPYRLFPPDYRPTSTFPKPKAKRDVPVPPGPTQLQTPPPTPPTSTSLPPPEPASIPCPGCSIEICCKCKQLAHQGALCPEGAGELDPELAALLKKWKIRRCPKCRGAVRLMYGCSHMACRCGDQWCWHCRQPIEVCQAYGCPGESSDEEGDSYDSDLGESDNDNENETGNDERNNQIPPEDRDLDSGTRERWEDGEFFFGEEPVPQNFDPFDCYHTWMKATTEDVNRSLDFACEKCWRHISPRPFTYPEVVELLEHGFIPEKSVADGGNQEKLSLRLFMCARCSIMLCDDCRDEDTAIKVAGKTWEWAKVT